MKTCLIWNPVFSRDLVSGMPTLCLTMAFPKTMVDDEFMVKLIIYVYIYLGCLCPGVDE